MTELSDLISEANRERGLSTRDIQADAERRGHKLSHSTAGKILSGSHGRISLDTVLALEDVFGIHRDKISAAAHVPLVREQYEPPREGVMLTVRQRTAITNLILSIVNEGGAAHGNAPATKKPDPDPADQSGTVTPIRTAGRDRAARTKRSKKPDTPES